MAIFVSDLFTDDDATALQDHAPDTGGAWVEMEFTSFGIASVIDAEINTNRCRSTSETGRSSTYRNAADPGDNEYDVSFDMTVGTDGAIDDWMLYGRMTSAGTSDVDVDRYQAGYFYHSVVGSRGYYLYKIIDGGNTLLDSLIEDPGEDTFDLRFEIRDAAKKLYLDDVEKLSSADDAITQDGRAGLSCPPHRINTNYLDNFLAETPAVGIGADEMMAAIGPGGGGGGGGSGDIMAHDRKPPEIVAY